MLTVIAACAGWIYIFTPAAVRAADDTPIAFWSWRSELPSQELVDQAVAASNAGKLFVRAGTIDTDGSSLKRIRPVAGTYPIGIEIHLVYNATPDLLEAFESTDLVALADVVVASYEADAARAGGDGVSVAGVQLDLDVPTRLLGRYGELLAEVRTNLPPEVQLSVTGLPTWMTSKDLAAALAPVDFWVPQFYGGAVPRDVRDATPIASAESVRAGVRRAQRLGKPFLAGLAAYGYTLHFNRDGSLRALHGTVSPERVRASVDVERVDDAAAVRPDANLRSTYRVVAESVLAGMRIVPGDWIVVETPSPAVLRESARAVREEGGSELLGICVFRLPESDDPAVLRLSALAASLEDRVVADEEFAAVTAVKSPVLAGRRAGREVRK